MFESTGQLGRDLAAVDWASTLLGPVDDWSHSLRSVVPIMLTSRFKAVWCVLSVRG